MRRFNPLFVTAIVVFLLFAAALCIRVFLPYDVVFGTDVVKFTSGDAYYHMRIADNLVFNFPTHTQMDPYFMYQETIPVTVRFFGWLLALTSWIFGLGSPTQHTVDVVGVYLPAVIGALTVIPVFFIGKELFGKWAGLAAAAILAVIPGEFLGRSILGFTDYDIFNVLLTTTAVFFLLKAIKAARQNEFTWHHLLHPDRKVITRPVVFSVLAGIFLALYVFTWLGALLFVFIFALYFILQFVIDHLRGRSSDYLGLTGGVLFGTVVVLSPLLSVSRFYFISILIAFIIPPALSFLSIIIRKYGLKPLLYPVAVIVLGLGGLGILYLIDSAMVRAMLEAFDVFTPAGAELTTIEMQSMFKPYTPGGGFLSTPFWYNFFQASFMTFFGLLLVGIAVVRRGKPEITLFLVWSLVILIACWGQRRFGIYMAANVAILSGFIAALIYYVIKLVVDYLRAGSVRAAWDQVLAFSHIRDLSVSNREIVKEKDYYELLGISGDATEKQVRKAYREFSENYSRDNRDDETVKAELKAVSAAYETLSDARKRAAYDRRQFVSAREAARKAAGAGVAATRMRKLTATVSMSHVNFCITAAVFFFTTIGPFFVFTNPEVAADQSPAVAVASRGTYAPSNAWANSLTWLRENSAEPFGDAESYYDLFDLPDAGQAFVYPESAYGVLSWWDYGYWITRIGHRLPNANPSQDPETLKSVGRYFTSSDEAEATEIINDFGAEYVIIDNDMAYTSPYDFSGKFYAMATWAEKDSTEFFDVYYFRDGDYYSGKLLYHLDYYTSMAARLYFHDGAEVTSDNTTVIQYDTRETAEGDEINIVSEEWVFDTYDEAVAYIDAQESGTFRIVGEGLTSSPIPLEALDHYELVHSSNELTALYEGTAVPEVKIFKFTE